VIEGRDIGSVVFPDAALKVYLTADERERARRRAAEAGMSPEDEVHDWVAADLARRDKLDSTREASPMKQAEDALVIDTSDRTVDDIVDVIVGLL